MQTYADVCRRLLTYADVCWRMLTYAYAVAFAYCIGDVAYVGYKESKKEDGNVPRAVAFQTTFQVV